MQRIPEKQRATRKQEVHLVIGKKDFDELHRLSL